MGIFEFMSADPWHMAVVVACVCMLSCWTPVKIKIELGEWVKK